MAGWSEFPPDHPKRWADTDPRHGMRRCACKKMDEYGIHAQVLYPNVALFNSSLLVEVDEAMTLEFLRSYNDYQTDWSSVAPDRLLPMTSLPFWNLDATLAEIDRCTAMGHRGIVFSQDPSAFGLPALTDRHWDPMWASAEEKGLPVNFHIASGDISLFTSGGGLVGAGPHANYASMGVSFFMGNARTISALICGGICHRFPELNFVSVESGIGWIPFALDSLDWQWKNCGVALEHPEYDLLPSEYFKRQMYGCFWFERETARAAIDWLGDDNFLYETDFRIRRACRPVRPPARSRRATSSRPPSGTCRSRRSGKVLHDNAARIYHLESARIWARICLGIRDDQSPNTNRGQILGAGAL